MTMQLPVWVVYDHPQDFPDHFVARLWEGMDNTPTATVLVADTLAELRDMLPPDLNGLERMEGDDPTIVETWL